MSITKKTEVAKLQTLKQKKAAMYADVIAANNKKAAEQEALAIKNFSDEFYLHEDKTKQILLKKIGAYVKQEGSQRKLAKRIGIDNTTISRAIAKGNITYNVLFAIKVCYDVSFDWLLLGQAVPSSGVKYLESDTAQKNLKYNLKKSLEKKYGAARDKSRQMDTCDLLNMYIVPAIDKDELYKKMYKDSPFSLCEVAYISKQLNISIEELLTKKL